MDNVSLLSDRGRAVVGIALLVQAISPLGDMSIILWPGGGRSRRRSNSWRNLRGDACRRPLVDPCHFGLSRFDKHMRRRFGSDGTRTRGLLRDRQAF